MYYVYIIQCADDSLYTGITTDIERRFKEHRSGRGSAYTRSKKAKEIVYIEKHKNRSGALRREAEIKSWRRKNKISLIRARPKK